MFTEGIRIGRPSSSTSGATSGLSWAIKLTSKLVPPISMQIRFGRSKIRARPAPPIAPPTGPDRSVWSGRSRAARAVRIPPLDCITWMSLSSPRLRASSSNLPRYCRTVGAMYASRTAEDVRSYSRHSRATRCDRDTLTSGSASANISATRCSCALFTYENRNATATAPKPSFRTRSIARSTSTSSSGSSSLPAKSSRPRTSTMSLRDTSGAGFR